MLWSFQYQREQNSESGSQVLHLVSRKQSPVLKDTTVTIRGPASLAYLRVDPSQFLFLQPAYLQYSEPPSSRELSGLEILREAQHAGRVYAHGILIREYSELKGFGINYLGSGKSLRVIGISRDRDSARIDALIGLIPSLVAHLKRSNPEQYFQLLPALFQLINEHPDSAIRHLYWLNQPFLEFFRRNDFRNLAKGLKDVFLHIHGPEALASSTQKVP